MMAARFIGRVLVVQLLASQLLALHTYDFCPNECGEESGNGVCEVRFANLFRVVRGSSLLLLRRVPRRLEIPWQWHRNS
jgi:hypothetical protein